MILPRPAPTTTPLALFVIYDHPKDYPGHFVVRKWLCDVPTDWIQWALTLEGARALVPEGLCRLSRSPDDDPVIVETWI